MHPMNHPTRAIVATMIVSFSLSFAAMWWQRRAAMLAVPVLITKTPRPSAPSIAPAFAPPAPSKDSPHPPVPVTAPAAATAIDAPSNNYDGPELPVIFSVLSKSVYTAEEDAQGAAVNVTKNVNEAIVVNSSDKPLTIIVTEVNIPTQEASQAQLVLPPGGQRHFGENDGLKMVSGDQLTLRSPSYRDLTRQIP